MHAGREKTDGKPVTACRKEKEKERGIARRRKDRDNFCCCCFRESVDSFPAIAGIFFSLFSSFFSFIQYHHPLSFHSFTTITPSHLPSSIKYPFCCFNFSSLSLKIWHAKVCEVHNTIPGCDCYYSGRYRNSVNYSFHL